MEKTTYCMSCGEETRNLISLIGGWYCRMCAQTLKSKNLTGERRDGAEVHVACTGEQRGLGLEGVA